MAGERGGLTRRIEALRADTTSGASAITQEAIAIFFAARSAGADIEPIARSICAAQPSMASLWNAAAAALSGAEQLARFEERLRRAPAAVARFAVEHFADERSRPLRLTTLSYSSSVVVALKAIHTTRPLSVSCSESRPALEGRRLAADLAAAAIPVTLFGDSAIGGALDDADGVIVGADAIAPSWLLNKAGTRMLAAAAAQRGVPVYVAATRDKFVGQQIAERLVIRSGNASEIWDDAPPGVGVRNPYFEMTPFDLVTAVISDLGILGTGMIPDVCEH